MDPRRTEEPSERAVESGSSRLRWVVVLLCAAALLLPLWMVDFPPLLDYPNHLASAFVLQHLHDPAYRFADFYRAEWHAYPNLLMTALMLALGRLVPMEIAGRLVLSLCVLALPLGTWRFLRVVNPAEERQALWGLVLAYNPMFLRGFLNYQFSIALCLLVLAAWIGYVKTPGWRRWCVLLGLMTPLYFTHLGGVLVAGVVMTVWLAVARRPRLLPATWALYLPSALLYFLSLPQGIQPIRFATYHYRLDEKLEYLFTPFVGYTTWVDYACCVLAAAGFLFCLVRNRELRFDHRWVAPTLLLLAIFWFAPADPGASEANRRLMPFILLLLLAAARLGEKGRALMMMAVLVFGLRIADTACHFVAAQPRLHAMAQAFPATPANARVVPLVENWRDPEYVKDSYYQFWAYGVVRRGWLVPSLFARPEIHALRLDRRVYVPLDRTGYQYFSNPDWAAVRRQYDYVWAYGVPEFEAPLDALGRPVVSSGLFRFVRIEPHPAK